MRVRVAIAVACLSVAAASLAADVEAAIRRTTDIPEQLLDGALQALAKERQLQMIYAYEVVGERRTGGARGELTFDEAMTSLLAGTGLTYRFLDEKTVTIIPAATAPATRNHDSEPSGSQKGAKTTLVNPGAASGLPAPESGSETKSVRQRLRLAQADAPSGSTADGSANGSEPRLEEIVVTAQKREQRLQDVPIPVTAVNAQSLLRGNQLRLQDFYSKVPGLNYSPGQWGEPRIAIRGVVTDPYTNPTVGLVIDDIPYGLSINQNGGGGPDIDPGDLSRIEVLRGPQGTLYGAASMGGLLKYVTISPSTEAVSGRVQVGATSVKSGDDPGYSVRGSVNLPVSDTFALRASAFKRREPGYIDNVQTGQDDINEIDARGARVAALWRASESVSLKLSALAQKSEADGSQVVEPDLGGLRQAFLPTAGEYTRRAQAYSAILSARLGALDFASLTGYSKDTFRSGLDVTGALGDFAQLLYGVPYVYYRIDQNTRKFSQEFRISAPIGTRLEWRLGAFFSDERIVTPQLIAAADATATPVGTLIDTDRAKVKFSEYAAFGDLTIHVTDRFDLQIGARRSRTEQRNAPQAPTGPFAGPATPRLVDKGKAFTYLFTPEFKVSPDLMVYARAASGYRPGGINFYNPVLGALPPYTPDKTRNYEVGVKGSAFNRMLTFDASAYHIDWDDIQLLVTNVISYYDNAGSARSQGIELSGELEPVQGLKISAWGAWGDAELTEDFPATSNIFGGDGDRLPYSSRFSGNLSVDYEFAFVGSSTASWGAGVRYVGNRAGGFRSDAATPQPRLPGYSQIDTTFTVNTGPWAFTVFGTNLTDKRGVTGIAPYNVNAFNYIQPRTIGLTATRNF